MFIPKTASDRVVDLHLAQRTRTTAKPSSNSIHERFRIRPWARGRLSALFLMSFLGLLVTQARADDHGDTRSTATNVGLPSATAGAIQFAGDYDYFRFTVPSSQNITANTTGATDTFGDLFDVNGSLLASNDDANGSLNFSIAIQLNAGTYYVRVRHYSSGVNTGSYQLLLSGSVVPPPVTDDHGNTITSATAVNMPSTTSGAIQFAGDYDCFRFSISGGMNVTACSAGSTDTVGELLDSAGAIVVSNDDGPDGTRNFSMTRQLNAGTYYVRVRHYSSSANSGAYQLLLSGSGAPPPVTDDHGNTIATATSVSVPSTTSGAINFAGDYDYFRFTISEVRNFTATTQGSTDTFGDLLNAAGTVLVSNDDANGSTNFLINYQLNAGTYYVRVRHYYNYIASGQYQLLLSVLPPADDHSNSYSSATNISVPSSTAGVINYMGDYDLFQFTLTTAKEITVSTTGNTDTQGRLQDSGHVNIGYNDDFNGSSNFSIVRTLNPGTYFVQVNHHNPSATSGNYQLVLAAATPQTPVIEVVGNGSIIANGDSTPTAQDNTYFGESLYLGHSIERDFVINNRGGNTLVLNGNPPVVLTWLGQLNIFSDEFVVLNQPALSIPPGGSSSFRVRYLSKHWALNTMDEAVVRISSNAGNFDCIIRGKAPTQEDVVANTFESATDVTSMLNNLLTTNPGEILQTGGEIDYNGDIDMYTFTVTTATPRHWVVFTRRIAANAATDTMVTLYNSQRIQIASDDDGNGNGQFKIDRILAPGTYYYSITNKPGTVTPSVPFWIDYIYE